MPSAEEAHLSFFKGRSVYDSEPSWANILAFDLGRLSFPEDTRRAPCIEDVLPPAYRQILEGDLERMRHDAATDPDTVPYSDPAFRGKAD